jgi:hypothetical protein
MPAGEHNSVPDIAEHEATNTGNRAEKDGHGRNLLLGGEGGRRQAMVCLLRRRGAMGGRPFLDALGECHLLVRWAGRSVVNKPKVVSCFLRRRSDKTRMDAWEQLCRYIQVGDGRRVEEAGNPMPAPRSTISGFWSAGHAGSGKLEGARDEGLEGPHGVEGRERAVGSPPCSKSGLPKSRASGPHVMITLSAAAPARPQHQLNSSLTNAYNCGVASSSRSIGPRITAVVARHRQNP